MIYNSVKKEIECLLENSKKDSLNIQISYSGGMDSSCLLDILLKIKNEIKIEVFISYVNFFTSNYSTLVKDYIINSFPENKFFIESSQISKNDNFESNARKIRYNFLRKIEKKHCIDYTFTAHHQDDQFETVLMKFLDGSDEITKQGIRRIYNKIYRPLLKVRKKDIEKYCINNNITYFIDPTNNDICFKRNKIRKILIPMIKNDTFITDKIISTNIESLKLLRNYKISISALIKKIDVEEKFGHTLLSIKSQYINDKSILFLKLFFKKVISKFYNDSILIKKKSFWLSFQNFLNKSRIGSIFIMSDSIRILKDRQCLIVYSRDFKKIKIEKKIKLVSKNILSIGKVITQKKYTEPIEPNEFLIDRRMFDQGVYIRTWRKGDKIFFGKKYKKVSDLFIDSKLPRIKKKSYLILEDANENIIWIPGLYRFNFPKTLESYKIIYDNKI